MNNHRIVGNIGRDPESRFLPDGTELLKFSVATSNDYFDRTKKEWVKRDSDWHNVVAFKDLAKKNNHLVKGDKVQVEGQSKNRTWEDKDGNKRNATEIHARSILQIVKPASQNTGSNDSGPDDSYNYGQ